MMRASFGKRWSVACQHPPRGYGHVFSDPVNFVDPSGLFIDAFVDAAILGHSVLKLVAGCGSWSDVGLAAASLAPPGVVGLSIAAKSATKA